MDSGAAARFAQVAVLAQLGRAGGLFTYGLPESLAPLVGPGSLVRVPFAKRQLQGVVCSLETTCDLPRVRDMAELLDPVPAVTGHQLRLADWISRYYAAPISDVLGAMLPPGLGRKTVYALEPGADPDRSRLTPEQRQVLSTVHDAGRTMLDDVQHSLPDIDVERAVASLVRRGLLHKVAELAPPRVAARTVRVASATPEGRHALNGGKGLQRAALQRAVLEQIAQEGPLAVPDLSRRIPGAQTAVSALEKKGFVALEQRTTSRSPLDIERYSATQPLHLSAAQLVAYEALLRSIKSASGGIFLLHGVTGSGKTEVYLQAIADVIRTGRQAIMMVPEISLTPQAVERVAGRFPGRVAVLHSKLSAGERLDEWQRIRHGEVDVVVGPRSALFAPLPYPGLIVVDEEHDPSYKQDSMPRYNARDAAAVLGRLTGATVVFGSATPDVGTYYAAQLGRITLLELPDRPVWTDTSPPAGPLEARPMPSVEVVDMRHELKAGNRSIFSSILLEALGDTLRDSHQALLFLNRRGSATVVICRDCGFVVRCPNCDIPYTYHASATRLICHRCDKRTISPQRCSACGSERIRYLGVGTQRVEEEVTRLFPDARVLRWDRDVTGGKGAHEEILQRFSRHDADILVGTQMIAKGLDFPLVTLVGVISADTGLHMPDFRAPERSFQLLTQVAGRAGRASLPSRVVVQTYTPDHYAVQAARDHDYHRFYRDEIVFREGARYPPFARLMRFVYSAERESLCRQSAANLRSILERAIEAEELRGAEIIGPAPCFVARIKNRYYWQIIARGGEGRNSSLHPLVDYVPPGWTIDVDPVDLL
ncbi:MAG TPA: primosomal protein N' [Chloroflexota bacterium]